MKQFKLLSIGTSGMADKEAVNRIILVNKISLAVSLSIAVIGPTICYYLKWHFSVLIPLSVEFIINWSILILNYYRKHLAASLVLYFLQCVAIVYFGFALVRVLYLEFVIVLLIAVIYLIFKEAILRRIALAAALIDLVALEVFYYKTGPQTEIPISYDAAFLIHALVVVAIISITILVSKPYVQSNDMKYELKRANYFMKTFIFQVTHELRSSLDSIHQATQLLQKEAPMDDYLKHSGPLLDIALTASSDARNIVNNVLDMAEIEAGKTPPSIHEAFEVKPFFDRMLEVYKILTRDRRMKLRLNIDMPEVIFGDPLSVSQIFANLLSNAIKYGTKGSTVNVEVKRGNITWELKVSNSGDIPEEKIGSIFDPFVTGKAGHTQGTGLGLYIVKNKVSSMKGIIQVQSKPGSHTVFTVTLPLREGTRDDLPDDIELHTGMGDLDKVHVLVAEDNKLTAFLLSRFLNDIGCSFTILSNGQELLEAVQRKCPDDCPDIIILDANMPLLNGEATIRELKKDPGLSHIPIIVTTGDVFSNTIERMLAAGADTYLKKPIDHLALEKTIHLYLKKRALH